MPSKKYRCGLFDAYKYMASACGSEKWKDLFAERTAIERVNAYLKEFFQVNNVCHRTGKKAKLHFNLVTFVYRGLGRKRFFLTLPLIGHVRFDEGVASKEVTLLPLARLNSNISSFTYA